MKSLLRLVSLFVFLAPALVLRGAAEADLGEGLGYVRLTDHADETAVIVAALAKHPQLVIDLRSLEKFPPALPPVLREALARPIAGKSLRIVLINATTARELVGAVSLPPVPNVITVGPDSPGVNPDLAVRTTADRDKQAHEALVKGAAPATLLNENREKKRFDEARLVQNHANGVQSTDEVSDSDATETPHEETTAAGTEKKSDPGPLLDLVLARAVHLHRAALALRQP